jgi:ABC-type multidrug transport system fused ATPase/permease subunit
MAAPALKLIDQLQDIKLPRLTVNKFTINHEELVNDIILKDINFNYNDNNKFNIYNVNLFIEAGTINAIVGRSGAGKTTLVDILLGVLSPTSGQILVAGKSPNDIINTFPGSLAYVPQDVFIINGTIRENVCLGYNKEDIPTELVYKALEKAQLTEFVENLPNKIDTYIGDTGSRLSGGQRQRLGIARAMLTEPRLLILDEATSSLDTETESEFVEALQQLVGKVTLVVIAHRLSTIKSATVIYQMKQGSLMRIDNLPKH